MIIKEKLAELSMVYAINIITIQGRKYCIAASEEKNGKLLLIDLETNEIKELKGLNGGVMNILPIHDKEGEFFAIQGFYPIFDSKNAEIVRCAINDLTRETVVLEVNSLKMLPYVHRIALVGETPSRKIIAATLCRKKSFIEDWSHPGDVYEFSLNSNMEIMNSKFLIEGIYKNHGLFKLTKNNNEHILIGGMQGAWDIDFHHNTQKKIYNAPISDLFMFDIDNDGVEEIICITPFHGNNLKILKKDQNEWITLMNEKMNFGHAIWCGNLNGQNILITSNRGGTKNIELYHLYWNKGSLSWDKSIVDKGVGASNIVVEQKDESIDIYSANHGSNEVAKYIIN